MKTREFACDGGEERGERGSGGGSGRGGSLPRLGCTRGGMRPGTEVERRRWTRRRVTQLKGSGEDAK